MKRLLISLLLLISIGGFAQKLVLTAKPNVSLSGASGGYYEAVPENLDKSKVYPLFIFFHGQGELGNGGPSDLPRVLNNAPMTYIRNGTLSIPAIFIAPQLKDGAPYAYVITQIVENAIKLGYPIDRTRVYVMGLSLGSVALWDLARGMAIKQVAAIIPVSGAWDNGSSPISTAAIYRDEKLPVWALHNQGDPTVSVNNVNTWIAAINSSIAKKTIFPVSGHDAWTKAFDPAFKENGLNVYEWAMQYTTARGQVTAPPVVQPPSISFEPAILPTVPMNDKNKIVSMAIGEYLAGAIYADGTVWGVFRPGSGFPKWMQVPGINDAVGCNGGQYSYLVWTKAGIAYEVNKPVATGAPNVVPFTIPGGVVYGQMFNETKLLVNPDGDLYYTAKPVDAVWKSMAWPLTDQPTIAIRGLKIKKIAFTIDGGGLLIQSRDNKIYTVARGTFSPVEVNIPGALDITSVSAGAFVVATKDDIFTWGTQSIYLGVNATRPTSFRDKIPGAKFPLKQIVGSWNVLQIIDADNWRFAGGDNIQGEKGNGTGNQDWKRDKFNWSWAKGLKIEPFQKLDQAAVIWGSGSMAFYFFMKDLQGNAKSFGRNKNYALANGEFLDWELDAKYPNGLSVYTPWDIGDPEKTMWKMISFNPATALNDRRQTPVVVEPPVIVLPPVVVPPARTLVNTILIWSDGTITIKQ